MIIIYIGFKLIIILIKTQIGATSNQNIPVRPRTKNEHDPAAHLPLYPDRHSLFAALHASPRTPNPAAADAVTYSAAAPLNNDTCLARCPGAEVHYRLA